MQVSAGKVRRSGKVGNSISQIPRRSRQSGYDADDEGLKPIRSIGKNKRKEGKGPKQLLDRKMAEKNEFGLSFSQKAQLDWQGATPFSGGSFHKTNASYLPSNRQKSSGCSDDQQGIQGYYLFVQSSNSSSDEDSRASDEYDISRDLDKVSLSDQPPSILNRSTFLFKKVAH